MRLSGFLTIVESLFTDRVDVYHYDTSVNSDGTTSVGLPDVPDIANVKCRISFSSSDSPKDSEVDETPVKFSPKLFVPVGTEIKAGDFVVARRVGDGGDVLATYRGTVGMPNQFVTHKEVLFYIKESA